jgi:hypothetical protein
VKICLKLLPIRRAARHALRRALPTLAVACKGGRETDFSNQDRRGEQAMSTPLLQQRIDSTYGTDRLVAIIFILMLWLAVGVVYLGIRGQVHDGEISLALTISAFLIVGYNTASLIAMIRHYAEDKNWIYEIDIRHQDEARQMKKQQG